LVSLREAVTETELAAPAAMLSWAVRLRDPEGNEHEVECPPGGTVEGKPGECRLHWPPSPLPDGGALSATLVVKTIEHGVEIALEAAAEDTCWVLDRITPLRIAGLRGGEEARLVVPSGWGLESPIPGDSPLRLVYPSMRLSCQFLALRVGEAGLYIGAHDPTCGHKEFLCQRRDEAAFTLECSLYPTADETRSFNQTFPLVLSGFRGGWHMAATIHRSWALLRRNAPPPLHLREDVAAWVAETDLWLVASGGSAEVVPQALEFARAFGVNCGVHWYCWHEIPFDDHYPDYFPAKPGFAEGVGQLRQAGIRVVPYINARLWDSRTDSWREEQAIRAAAKAPDGSTYEEKYGSGVALTVMCPYAHQWQEKVAGIVERLVKEFGVDGVYMDQVCSAGPVRCFDESHGHPPGGGHFWADGYRAMLKEIRRRLPQGAALATEDAADFLNDAFDFMLAVGTPHGEGELVPIYPAIYSGHMMHFGFQYVSGEDWKQPLLMRSKFARSLLWGSQLGWIGAEILAPQQAQQAEYMRRLAQFRAQRHQFFVYGRMTAPPRVEAAVSEARSVSVFGRPYALRIPHVQAAVWESPRGERALMVTNVSEHPERARITVPGDAQHAEQVVTEQFDGLAVVAFPLK